MKIETKFNVGDTAFVIYKIKHGRSVPCPVCHGEKHIMVKGNKFLCATCNNDGWVKSDDGIGRWEAAPDKYAVQAIVFCDSESYSERGHVWLCSVVDNHSIRSEDGTLVYHYSLEKVDDCGSCHAAKDNVFATIAEAQAECDKRNKK